MRRSRRKCILCPFVRGIVDGTLPHPTFGQYLAQDGMLLRAFAGACAMAAQKAKELGLDDYSKRLSRLRDGVDKELVLHTSFAASLNISLAVQGSKRVETQGFSFADLFDSLSTCADSQSFHRVVFYLVANAAPRWRLYHWLGCSLLRAGAQETAGNLFRWAEWYASDRSASQAAELGMLIDLCYPKSALTDQEMLAVYLSGLDKMVEFFTKSADEKEISDAEERRLLRAAYISPPRVLIVAGSDSGGGAGIQADIKACSAHCVFSTTAVTALTAQNTVGVQNVFPVPMDFVRQQMHSVLSDIGADVIKVGMLNSADVVEGVAEMIREVRMVRYPLMVLDPVMVSSSGHSLLEDTAVARIKECLIPLATVLTPNLQEASLLLGGRPIQGLEDMEQAARDLCAMGTQWALIKGGHSVPPGPEATDVLCEGSTGRCVAISAPWVETTHTHGTGCTLASTIAALLARGESIEQAVRSAKEYTSGAISASVHINIGSGQQGPMNHHYLTTAPGEW